MRLVDLTWPEVEALPADKVVALLPVGAIEAHGPHLPVGTDEIIAECMVEDAARRLTERELTPLVLPPVSFTAAPFAAGFPGTISVRAENVTAQVSAVADNLARWGLPLLAIGNAHLDPAHMRSLHAAVGAIRQSGRIRVAFPDVTRKPWALRLTDEFKSGACHAGSYEGSVVLAARPELVRDEIRLSLPANPVSIAHAIREGKKTFEEAGGDQAYFGDPAAASAEEGHRTIGILGEILAEAVWEEWEAS